MFYYRIKTGSIYQNETWLGTGYSGKGKTLPEGRNNPDMITRKGMGPIPPGEYEIGIPYSHENLGPCVMNLDPLLGTVTFGRSLFRIHGNNAINDASHGCIILGPAIREKIAKSGDKYLTVSIE